MSQAVLYLLLFLALVLPVPGAIMLRLLERRLGEPVVRYGAAAIFAIAILSTLAITRADVTALRLGDLTLLRSAAQAGAPATLPSDSAFVGEPDSGPPTLPTLTPRPSATPRATATLRPTLTPESPTLTPEPPTVTPEPPTATPEPQATQRRYTIQRGDTLREVAERFGVTLDALLRANNLTPDQAERLRPGQEIVIP